MSPDIVKVSPAEIQWRLSIDWDELCDHDRLSSAARHLVASTVKHQSITQRYVDGRPWEETPLFTESYRERLTYESVRGCRTFDELLAQYYTRVDALFADLKANGWRTDVDRAAIPVYLSHDDELLMGNQGNHRLAMAQILKLDHVVATLVGRHPSSRRTFEVVRSNRAHASLELQPQLPESARSIPAMTTEAERRCYYRWTKEVASTGAVVELGAWLGASTAYIAAGLRDAGVATKAQVYDRFVWKPSSHDKKAGGPIGMAPLAAFNQNLGPLLAHVAVHMGELNHFAWKGGRIALLVSDAPKRIPEISRVLTAVTPSVTAGMVMAWQDFGYFPSYDIPAALMRLGDRVEFVEAVYPGTTAVFRVVTPWKAAEVSPAALSLQRWTPDDVESAWAHWRVRLPEPMRPRFDCGAAMFLCDLGAHDRAKARLTQIIAAHRAEVLPKWRYLVAERASLMQRYQPLVEVLP